MFVLLEIKSEAHLIAERRQTRKTGLPGSRCIGMFNGPKTIGLYGTFVRGEKHLNQTNSSDNKEDQKLVEMCLYKWSSRPCISYVVRHIVLIMLIPRGNHLFIWQLVS